MSNESENLAFRVRQVLGNRNDESKSVVQAVYAAICLLERERDELERRNGELEAINLKLATFADSAIEAAFDGADLDGGTIQEWLEADGLLVRRPDLTVPCGESCACMEGLGEGPQCDSLFRSDELLKALTRTKEQK